MKKRILPLLFIAVLATECTFGQTLKVATINVWTGLDYVGYRHIGEYEPPAVRDQRTRMLIQEFKSIHADLQGVPHRLRELEEFLKKNRVRSLKRRSRP